MQVTGANVKTFFDTVRDLIAQFGWVKGTFTVFFWAAHFWIFRLYQGRLKDRQSEIDRLAADNHEYREQFMKLLDKGHSNDLPKGKG